MISFNSIKYFCFEGTIFEMSFMENFKSKEEIITGKEERSSETPAISGGMRISFAG